LEEPGEQFTVVFASIATEPHCRRHITEHLKQIFPEKGLRSYNPNSYIHVSLSDLFIPLIGMPFLLQENKWTERGNI
jgi:hypothetical protein